MLSVGEKSQRWRIKIVEIAIEKKRSLSFQVKLWKAEEITWRKSFSSLINTRPPQIKITKNKCSWIKVWNSLTRAEEQRIITGEAKGIEHLSWKYDQLQKQLIVVKHDADEK